MLTELDNCILGVIWREGPMSAYDIRSHFAGSTTVTWSSSTGTVYPAIRRLREGGLVKAGARTGPRGRQLLTLSSRGVSALRDWLEQIQPELGAATADPLRTRVHFLGALGSRERRVAFEKYRSVTRASIRVLEQEAGQQAKTGIERSEQLGIRGALMELKARLAWLNSIERDVLQAD